MGKYRELVRVIAEKLDKERLINPSYADRPAIERIITEGIEKAVSEALACNLPLPMSAAELDEADGLLHAREYGTIHNGDKQCVCNLCIGHRLLDHARCCERLLQDVGKYGDFAAGQRDRERQLIPMLRKMEWLADTGPYRCHFCRRQSHQGHTDDCLIGSILKEINQ